MSFSSLFIIDKISFKDPTFIVTLDGIEGQKKAAGQQKKDAPPAAAAVAPEKTSDASKVMAAFKFKPTAVTSTPATTSKESAAAPSTTKPQVNANSNKSEVRLHCIGLGNATSTHDIFPIEFAMHKLSCHIESLIAFSKVPMSCPTIRKSLELVT